MKGRLFLIWFHILASIILGACGTPENFDTQATRIAGDIFATQTAEANLYTPTFTSTPTPTLAPTLTPTLPSTPAVEVIETKSSGSQIGETVSLTKTPSATPTPSPTVVLTPSARIMAEVINFRAGPGTAYPIVGQGQQNEIFTVTGRDDATTWWQVIIPDGQTAWVSADLIEVDAPEKIMVVATPSLPAVASDANPAANRPSPDGRQWVLVADSAADFPGPMQDRKWWYLWSQGRGNFNWQDMNEGPECYHSPNEMTLEICRDRMVFDTCDAGEIAGRHCSRGDAALLWKAREGGTYRFEWNSSEVNGKTTLWFYKHLDFVGNQGPGSELPYSATIEDVIEWELFFWVLQYDTPYQVKVYKLQE